MCNGYDIRFASDIFQKGRGEQEETKELICKARGETLVWERPGEGEGSGVEGDNGVCVGAGRGKDICNSLNNKVFLKKKKFWA